MFKNGHHRNKPQTLRPSFVLLLPMLLWEALELISKKGNLTGASLSTYHLPPCLALHPGPANSSEAKTSHGG